TTPITVDELRTISRALPPTVRGTRDRALLLVGYGAALRPGELVRLAGCDLTVGRAGLAVRTERGVLRVPHGSAPELCSVTAWGEWARVAAVGDGPAFRAVTRGGAIGSASLGEKAVGRIVRRAAEGAGLDASRFSGLSLRRG